MSETEWFASWFDSPYYHLLYNNRDEDEASAFIGRLVERLDLPKGARVVDLGCGKGRHSRTLAQLGLSVTGLDLSPESIDYANGQNTPNATFKVHDMRDPFPVNDQDAVFNLFTSFGYFDDPQVNERVIGHISGSLKPKGFFVIDYLSVPFVQSNLVPEETVHRGNIAFAIKRWIDQGCIYKQINFSDKGVDHEYTERVQLLDRELICDMLSKHGFSLVLECGDYALNPYQGADSSRLILVGQRDE